MPLLVQSPSYNQKEIDALKRSFTNSPLQPRMVSLIVHGSSLFFPIPPETESDIDLELILWEERPDDYQIIQSLLQKSLVKVECQLRYLHEISDSDELIQFSSYKLFMYYAYSNGICLYGKNIYKTLINNIPQEKVLDSLVLSVQIAFKDIRKGYFAGKSDYEINKNVSRTFLLICLYHKLLKHEDLGTATLFEAESLACVPQIIELYQEELSKSELMTLRIFLGYFKRQMVYTQVFSIVNKLVHLFSKNVSKGRL